MISYVEYLNIPVTIAIIIIAIFLFIQIVGEILEFKGKVVPEFAKVRKYFHRKKKERETIANVQITMEEVKKSMDIMNAHYSTDNIKMRDNWIKKVNDCLEKYDQRLDDLSIKLDKNNQDTMELLIENMRSTIIGFATTVADSSSMVTREQFNRVFKIYHRYEEIIKSYQLTNGEVDIAYRIIKESYESHLRNHTFIEDIKGYN